MHQLSANLRKKIQPWRGSGISSAAPDLKKVVARLREVRNLDALAPVFKALKIVIDPAHKAALKARTEQPIEALQAVEPEVEAALLCLLGGNDFAWDRVHEIGADMVHLWCSKGSVVNATRALVLNADYDGSGQLVRPQSYSSYFPYVGPWRALRGYLAAAPESEFQMAFSAAREGARGELRWMAAHAFPCQSDFVREVTEAALGRDPKFQMLALLASVDDADLLRRLADHVKGYLGSDDFTGLKFGDFLTTAVARLGNDSFPALALLGEHASKAGDKRMLAELMCELDHPEVGPWLQARGKDKAYGPAANAYAIKQESGPVGTASPGATRRPEKSPATESGPSLATGDPGILASPPWENRAPKRKPKVWSIGPASGTYPVTIHFPPGRRELVLANTTARDEKETESWKTYYNENLHRGHFPEKLCELTDKAWALEQWNNSPAQRWNPYTLRDNYWLTVPERLLACFGVDAVPGILTTLSVAPDVNYAGLAIVESPGLAKVWAEAWATKKKFRKLANSWFTRFPKAAALGLLPEALGAAGKTRTWCEQVLRWMQANGLGDSLREAAAELQAGEGLEEILAYDPLQELPNKMPSLPAWFQAGKIAAPRCEGVPLSPQAVANLALMVAISTLETPYAGLERTGCDQASLSEFAFSVYEQWLQAGGPAKEDWGFRVLAYLGGDEAARRLAPALRRWPAEGLSSRASLGLDILRAIGSDVALTHLHGIALKVRFKALQDKAEQHIQEIADSRGLSVEELADRLVPDLDLDSDGVRQLGEYRVSFDELLRPQLFDPAGKVLSDLPKSAPAELSKEWKALKKDAKAVAAVQLERLEQAMTGCRRWSAETFQLLIVEHPLLGHLARRLVWGIYDDQNGLRDTFRVAEDRSFADCHDGKAEIAGTVGVFHPAESPETVATWRTIFDDYQILQPFPQLHRSTHQLAENQIGSAELTLVQGVEIPGAHLLSLERRGWRRGSTESGALCDLKRGGLCLELDSGLPLDGIADSVVCLGKVTSEVPLRDLPAVTLSELLRDLEHLTQKALDSV